MNCQELLRAFADHPLHGWVCRSEEDLLRLETPLRYPDGGTIEVFVLAQRHGFVVTDLREAFRFLETHGIDPTRGAGRTGNIQLALKLAGAQHRDGEIEIRAEDVQAIFPAAIRLAQAMSRIADLVLQATGSLAATFSDAVEQFIQEGLEQVEVQRGGRLRGNVTEHTIDILVRSARGTSAIEGLSASSPAGANAQTAFTIKKFADLAAIGPNAPSRLAVLDDSAEVWTDALRRQLEQFSTVLDWEQRDRLLQVL